MLLFWWTIGCIVAAVWCWRLIEAALGFGEIADLRQTEWDHDPLCRVSVVVPAKDEAESIERCLRSLVALDLRNYEIIAVNDRSRDKTGEIMDQLADEQPQKLKTLHIEDLPSGWLGKTHAMWTGAQLACGDWLLFTDGDVFFQPDAVRRAVACADKVGAHHLVLLPTPIMPTFGEQMMLGFFQSLPLFAPGHRFWKVHDANAKDFVGVGAFNLIRRDVYERIGGFRTLRMEILDDMMLGKAVKENGFTQRAVFGRDLVRLRWARGASGIVRNLTKNLFSLMEFKTGRALAASLAIAFFTLSVPVGLIFAPGWSRLPFTVVIAGIAAMYGVMSRKSGVSPFYCITHPIAAALFIYALLRSMVLTLRQGGIVWRGTTYSLDQLRAASMEDKVASSGARTCDGSYE
jgi:glycosyltransferase involved in cell wall biosynthesis